MAPLSGLSAAGSHRYRQGATSPNREGRPMVKDAAPAIRNVPPPPAVTRMAAGHGARSAAAPVSRTLLPPFIARWSTPAPRARATTRESAARGPAAQEHGVSVAALPMQSADELAAHLEALAAALRQDGYAALHRFAERDDLARTIASAVAAFRAGETG
jgi:hypothetical protein